MSTFAISPQACQSMGSERATCRGVGAWLVDQGGTEGQVGGRRPSGLQLVAPGLALVCVQGQRCSACPLLLPQYQGRINELLLSVITWVGIVMGVTGGPAQLQCPDKAGTGDGAGAENPGPRLLHPHSHSDTSQTCSGMSLGNEMDLA